MKKYKIHFTRFKHHVAECLGCGWKSEPFSTAGLAGAAFDRHEEESHGADR
jgi:hypothetical protein